MSASAWSPNAKTVPQVNVNGLVKQETQTATDSQRTFELSSFAYSQGTGSILAYLNGKVLTRNEDFFEIDGTTIMLAVPTVSGDKVTFLGFVGLSGTLTVDTQLRNDILAATGGNIINWKHTWAGAIARQVTEGLRDAIYVENFGVVGDDATNNTAALQNAINIVGLKAAFTGNTSTITLKFRSGVTYYVPGTVYLPSFVALDGCGANVRGNGTNTFVETGYFSGVSVVSNHSQPVDTQFVVCSAVKNFNLFQINRAFNMLNFGEGSFIDGIRLVGCNQVIYAQRCFYSRVENIHARSPLDPNAYPAFHFDDEINAQCIQNNFAVGYASSWRLSGTKDNVVIHNCGAETGTSTGMDVFGPTSNLRLSGMYFENIPYAINFDAGSNHSNVVIENSWFNTITSAAINGSTVISGDISNNNQFNGATIQLSTNFSNRPNVHIPTDVVASNSTAALPVNYQLGDGVNVNYIKALYDPVSGAITKKAKIFSGPVPKMYSGDTGADIAGVIPFCTVVLAPTTVTINTQIRYRETAAIIAALVLPDSTGQEIIKVLIAGGDILSITKPGTVTLTVNNNAGYFQLVASGLSTPTNQYYGTVELL